MTSKVTLCTELSPEGSACMVAYKLFDWSDEKFESELKQLGEWDIYLKFKQDFSEASSSSSDSEN